jgi:acetolactate synthase-1/3 small subunit
MTMKPKTKHSLAIRLINNPGCVIRIALVLERRGFAIESLQIKNMLDGYSEMSMVVLGDSEKMDQINKQLSKLIDIVSVKESIREEATRRASSWTNSWTKVLTRSYSSFLSF